MRLEPHRLVFLDETGTTTKMTCLRGRCPRGQRLRSKAPFGHWMTQTFIAGLRCDKLTAPFVIDAPMNRRIFETYIEIQLAPTLKEGDVVITISQPTKVRRQRRRSETEAHGSCSCRPTAATSTPSRWRSQSSRPIYAPRLSEQSTPFGRQSGISATSSNAALIPPAHNTVVPTTAFWVKITGPWVSCGSARIDQRPPFHHRQDRRDSPPSMAARKFSSIRPLRPSASKAWALRTDSTSQKFARPPSAPVPMGASQ